MSRIRLILLSLLALFAVGALASASAFANNDACHGGTGEWQACGENTVTAINEELGSATPVVLENDVTGGNTATLKSKVGTVNITIQCQATVKDTLEDSGASKGQLTFTGCTVVTPSGCGVVVKPANFVDTTSVPLERIEGTFTGSEAGEKFVEIEVTVCALKNKYVVKGNQKCEVDANNVVAQEHKEHHQLVCPTNKSNLKFGTAVATFEATFTEVEPESDLGYENWWYQESS